MRFSLRQSAVVLACVAIILACSCEKHHVGELPEHGEHDRAVEGKAPETAPPPAPSATPTPAEFFPKSPPR